MGLFRSTRRAGSTDLLGVYVKRDGRLTFVPYRELYAPKLPRVVRDNIGIVTLIDGQLVVYWHDANHVSMFPYSEDFPTELDIARLCLECP